MIISEIHNRNRPSPLVRNVPWVAVFFILMMILPAAAAGKEGGILQREIQASENLVSVKLLGVTDYEITEIFDVLLMNAPGVMEAKRYRFRLDPRKPSVCRVEWQVKIMGTDVFQLESDLYNMLQNTASGRDDSCQQVLTLRPMIEDPDRLKAIRPWRASSREIQFLSDQRPHGDHKQRQIRDRGFE